MKPSRISTKLKVVGGLLSLIIFLIIGLTVAMNERSKKDSLIINIAGKQRMLTQKMSKEIFYLRHRDGHDFRDLDAAMELFQNNLNDLRFGNEDRGIYSPQNEVIKGKLDKVATQWETFSAELRKVKSGILSVKSDKEILSNRIEVLLNMSDRVVKQMVEKELDGVYIDLSGRQRMLSQRMGLFVERYLRTDNQEDYFLFLSARALYEQTINQFAKDPKIEAYPDLYTPVKKLHAYWQEFDAYITALLETEDAINTSIAYINQHNVKILNTMDDAVWLYTEHSENKNILFLNTLYLVALLAMVVILYSFTLVRDTVSNIDRFVSRAKRLANEDSVSAETMAVPEEMEEELQEASCHLQTYVNKVSRAMTSSEEAIKRAESAINELQTLAEDVEGALNDLTLDEETKKHLDQSVDTTEDIAIESSESLTNVSNMLKKLQANLQTLSQKTKKAADTSPATEELTSKKDDLT
jgi:nitrate/nitrite-specific signal transduction histidine kinase